MANSQTAPGIVGPVAGLDVPWLLRMRAEARRDHPFLIWAPFEAPARKWSYGEFHERVGALAETQEGERRAGAPGVVEVVGAGRAGHGAEPLDGHVGLAERDRAETRWVEQHRALLAP